MKPIAKRQILLAVVDAGLAVTFFHLGYVVRVGSTINLIDEYTGATVFCTGAVLLSLHIFGLYDFRERFANLQFLPRFAWAAMTAGSTSVAFFYFSSNWRFGRGAFLIGAALLLPSLALWRILYDKVARITGRPIKIVILGTGDPGRAIYDVLASKSDEFEVQGFVGETLQVDCQATLPAPFLGDVGALQNHPLAPTTDWIVVAVPTSDDVMRDVLACKMGGVRVFAMATLYEELTGRLPVGHLRDDWLVYSGGFELLHSPGTRRVKRLIDLVAALAGLVVSLPVALLAALAVKLSDFGDVFYRQERVGKNGRVFEVLKFRSMRTDAEGKTGAVWARSNDPRVTPVGRILRRLRIDEIPQMWNVLKGEMSFVGPRPERPEFVRTLTQKIPYYALRHHVEPGITGWAQVNYPYGASIEDTIRKLEYDLYYVRHVGALMDLQIILRTMRVILLRVGGP